MQERKSSSHSAMVSLGQTLKTTRSDAISPPTTISVRARSLALSQSNVGAYQIRAIAPNMVDSS